MQLARGVIRLRGKFSSSLTFSKLRRPSESEAVGIALAVLFGESSGYPKSP